MAAKKKVKVIKVKTNHGQTRWRAGRQFGTDEVAIPLSKLPKEHLAAIKGDKFLVAVEAEIDAAEITEKDIAEGAKLGSLLTAQLEEIKASLTKLTDEELIELQDLEVKAGNRDVVIAAIEAELDKR